MTGKHEASWRIAQTHADGSVTVEVVHSVNGKEADVTPQKIEAKDWPRMKANLDAFCGGFNRKAT